MVLWRSPSGSDFRCIRHQYGEKADGTWTRVPQPVSGHHAHPAGEKAALEVTRHHRLLETYLRERLDVPWEQVHAEADRLEHALSEDLEARLDPH